MKLTDKPNPGSPEALALGCICARMDNGHGRGCGYTDKDGGPMFFVTIGCPVHHPEDKSNDANSN